MFEIRAVGTEAFDFLLFSCNALALFGRSVSANISGTVLNEGTKVLSCMNRPLLFGKGILAIILSNPIGFSDQGTILAKLTGATPSVKDPALRLLQEKAHAGGGLIPKMLISIVWSIRPATVMMGGLFDEERVEEGVLVVGSGAVVVAAANADA